MKEAPECSKSSLCHIKQITGKDYNEESAKLICWGCIRR